MKNYKVYTLSDPITERIHYCGVTSKLLRKRLDCHVYDSKNKRSLNPKLIEWIVSLLDKGTKPIIKTVKEFSDKDEAYKNESLTLIKLINDGNEMFNIRADKEDYYTEKERLKNKDYNYELLSCYKYDMDGNYVCSYESVKEAASSNNVSMAAISRCLNEDKYSASCNGFYWSKKKQDKLEITLPIKGMTGKKRSEEQKQKARERMSGYKWSEEALKKRSKSVSKPIIQMNENGDVVKTWDSQKQVRETMGIKIYSNRFGMDNKQYGYHWDFA